MGLSSDLGQVSFSREDKTWITKFCNREANSYFCEVEEDFITDAFNLYGINSDFHLYKQAISVILNEYDPEATDG